MIRSGHTTYAARYRASSTYRKARRREALRELVAILGFALALTFLAGFGLLGALLLYG